MDAKRAIEGAIAASGMRWTFLRSGDFMDNYLPDDGVVGRVWATIVLGRTFTQHPHRALPLVSTRDVGRLGARAMAEGVYGAVPVVGDMLSADHIRATYREVMGAEITLAWGITASAALWADRQVALLAQYYDSEGAFDHIDPSATREVLPDVERFRAFLERHKREQQAAEEK
jgi:uncharacterized protein YbjT (DUF2867 family)